MSQDVWAARVFRRSRRPCCRKVAIQIYKVERTVARRLSSEKKPTLQACPKPIRKLVRLDMMLSNRDKKRSEVVLSILDDSAKLGTLGKPLRRL